MLVLLAAMSVGKTYAQKIDFNLPNKNDAQVLEPDFSGWAIGRQISDETSFLMSDNSSSIGILVESAPGLVGNAVNCNWWKDGCSKYSKLVSDGIYSVILDDQSKIPVNCREFSQDRVVDVLSHIFKELIKIDLIEIDVT